jgi:hypothetical protein
MSVNQTLVRGPVVALLLFARRSSARLRWFVAACATLLRLLLPHKLAEVIGKLRARLARLHLRLLRGLRIARR